MHTLRHATLKTRCTTLQVPVAQVHRSLSQETIYSFVPLQWARPFIPFTPFDGVPLSTVGKELSIVKW